MGEIRECLLRPEYQHLYTRIPCGVWMPAREIAEQLVARARQARLLSVSHRTFDARHFEFRGGESLVQCRAGAWTRWGDEVPG
jgi:hypothetical protein